MCPLLCWPPTGPGAAPFTLRAALWDVPLHGRVQCHKEQATDLQYQCRSMAKTPARFLGQAKPFPPLLTKMMYLQGHNAT